MNDITPNPREIEAVTKGAALLDKTMPGWAGRIDLSKLALESSFECVLGQLFDEPQTKPKWQIFGYDSLEQAQRALAGTAYATGLEVALCDANFSAGIVALRLIDVDEDYQDLIETHGFDQWYDSAQGKNVTSYAGLDAAWELAVKDRHNAGAV